ncbi:MAG TPA: S49 family peptidase [Candidatus Saccharimonadales bacterium]|nr:S49 family peptidase [Candidatus Saccharimonadales bacterium]
MRDFFTKHPFLKTLCQRIATIAVSWTTIVACVIVTVIIIGILFIPSAEPDDDGYSYVYGSGTNQLLSVKVTGPITGTDDNGLGFDPFGDSYTSGYYVKEQLYAAAENSDIAGVIMEVNSPGGTIYGSRAIADGVEYYKEMTGNPVYTYVEGVAASGGYWAASATDKIIADYGSDTGSIGVIMGPFQYYNGLVAEDGGLLNGGVITNRGIENTFITGGKSKDVGSPYRKLTPEEVATLQKSVNNEYDAFLRYVSKQRSIPEDTLRNTIGAMAYDNKTAQEYKLIDMTGSRETAYEELAEAVNIADDYQVVREQYIPTFLESLLSVVTRKPQTSASADLCSLTRNSLAYHGDVMSLCKAKE